MVVSPQGSGPAQQNRMYHDLAHLWPVISPPEEYRLEAAQWSGILREKLGPGRHHILELGVGGGHLLSHLAPEFQASAVDVSPEMVALSRRLNPEVEHHVGDMRTVRLEKRFHAVLVHDAVQYLLTEGDLKAMLATAREHLLPGGVFIAAPDWLRESFPGTTVLHWTRPWQDGELTLIEYLYDSDPADTTIESEFIFLLRQDGELSLERDSHLMGLFYGDEWLWAMEEAGFDVEKRERPVLEGGYGGHILVGVVR